ncbi:MAG: head GIN domain-containing protein [Bacteroidota bacterium]
MKNIVTICLVFFSITAFAQRSVTRDVGDFNELKVYDLIEVNLIQSDENKVVIKGDHTDDVKIINQNGKLKLRMEIDTRFQGEDTYIEVYFKNIGTIDANEGAYIVANEMIEQHKIELRAQEGGRIKVGLTVDQTKIKAVTGGVVEASGLSKSQEIKINTGGVFEGRDLKTQETKVGITAAGEADVNASDRVEVRVTAGGDVNIYGNPKEVNEKKLAGGRVKIMN